MDKGEFSELFFFCQNPKIDGFEQTDFGSDQKLQSRKVKNQKGKLIFWD